MRNTSAIRAWVKSNVGGSGGRWVDRDSYADAAWRDADAGPAYADDGRIDAARGWPHAYERRATHHPHHAVARRLARRDSGDDAAGHPLVPIDGDAVIGWRRTSARRLRDR